MAETDCDEPAHDVPFLPPDSHSVDRGKRLSRSKCTNVNQSGLRSKREIDASHADGEVTHALHNTMSIHKDDNEKGVET